MNIAENIKAIREAKGLKQIEVANHIGVDKSAYSKIEKGKSFNRGRIAKNGSSIQYDHGSNIKL